MKPTTTNVDFYNILLAQLVEIHTTVSATDSESATGQQQHQHHHQQQQQQQENQQQDDQQLLQLLLQLQEEEQTRGDGGDGGGTFLFNRNNRQYFVVNTSDSNNFDEFTCRYDNAMTAFSNQTKPIKQPTSQPTIHPSKFQKSQCKQTFRAVTAIQNNKANHIPSCKKNKNSNNKCYAKHKINAFKEIET